MKIINSDEINWSQLFLEHELIAVNYQPVEDCKGCKEINDLFEKLSHTQEYKKVKFLWIDSRNNAVAEAFVTKNQVPFIAAFKEGFLIECNSISDEQSLRELLDRLFTFQFKL